ncbi:phosphotransferase [Tabrizicola sp. TH137]|uniref:phosphotransferase n=1 Tax=Tabrizicola sp. TH137 TaxID=2067452 RepID=UPI0013040A48|nr:phosphotransferase [Tabrizicola sp. TH137]
MSDTPLGPLLDSRPPALAVQAVAGLVATHWGLTGPLTPLTSERDLNHRLDAPEGRFVVKIANRAEPHAMTRMQSRALRHAAAADPGLPIPRVIATRDGADDVVLPSGELLRLLTWVEGAPLAVLPAHRARASAVAGLGARLARALRGFADPAADHDLQWDIKHALRLRPLLPHITDPWLHDLASATLDAFEAQVTPVLPALRWQVIHGDLNPHNLLGDPAAPDRVTGILDFGDMVRTPLLCDLAIAAAYQIDPEDGPASLAAFAEAWHAVDPLTDQEARLLPVMVAARMVTTLAITSFRAARYPENAAYILRNFPSAAAGLTALASHPKLKARP